MTILRLCDGNHFVDVKLPSFIDLASLHMHFQVKDRQKTGVTAKYQRKLFEKRVDEMSSLKDIIG